MTFRAKSASTRPSVTALEYDIARRLAYWEVKSSDIQILEVTYSKALCCLKFKFFKTSKKCGRIFQILILSILNTL